jgi:hypothetical protein
VIDYTLKSGSHESREDGMCAMEWISYLAGEEHTDAPQCVDPVLRQFGILLNDVLPDDLRQRLRPYLARMIGTAHDGRARERLFMVGDWAVRVAAAAAMEAERPDLAAKLRGVPKVVDKASAQHAAGVAYEAARAADGVAYPAAYAAYAAYAVAASAADAADAAMWEKLLPSALDLLDKMLPTETVELPERMAKQYRELCARA